MDISVCIRFSDHKTDTGHTRASLNILVSVCFDGSGWTVANRVSSDDRECGSGRVMVNDYQAYDYPFRESPFIISGRVHVFDPFPSLCVSTHI